MSNKGSSHERASTSDFGTIGLSDHVFRIVRYGMIGILLSAGYLGMVSAMVVWFGLLPIVASPLSFALCLPVAYWGQAKLVFRARPKEHRGQLARFCVSAASGFLIVTAVPVIGGFYNLPYQLNILIVTLLVPATNYILFWLWVFRAVPLQRL